MAGGNDNFNDDDDLLSQLLDLDEEPTPKTSSPKEEEKSPFQSPTAIVADSDSQEQVSDKTEVISNQPEPQSLDDLLGHEPSSPMDQTDFLETDTGLSSTASTSGDEEFLSELLSVEAEENKETSAGLDGFDSREADEPFGDQQRDRTIVLGEDGGEFNASEADDPIDAALADYTEQQESTGSAFDLDNATVIGDMASASIDDLLEDDNLTPDSPGFEGSPLNERQELSGEDFAEVFQSGPIQLPSETEKKSKISPKLKKNIIFAAAGLLVVALFGAGIIQFRSESGVLGYRMEGFAVERVYRPPLPEVQAQFQKIFGTAYEALQKDDPILIEKQIIPVSDILVQDVRNLEAASLKLELLGRTMLWRGVKNQYPTQFDESYLRAELISKRAKQALNWPRILRAQAMRSAGSGEYQQSYNDLLKSLTEISPADDALLGELAFRMGNLDKARTHLEKVSEETSYRGFYFRALAFDDLAALTRLKAKYLPADIELSILSLTKENKVDREQLALVKEASSKVEEYPWLSIRFSKAKAEIYHSLGDRESARAEWKKILEETPNEAQVWWSLARSYKRDSMWDESIRAYQSAMQAGLEDETAILQFVRLQRDQGKIVEALDEIQRGQELMPTVPWFPFERGKTQVLMNQFDTARLSFEAALELEPNFEPATLNLAELAIKVGDLEEAEALFKQIPELSKNYSQALYGLGKLSEKKFNFEAAKKFYGRSISNDNKNIEAYTSLAALLLREEEDKKAEALLNQGLSHSPDSLDLRLSLAATFLFRSDLKAARGAVGDYFKTHGHKNDLQLFRVELLIAEKNFSEALELLAEIEKREVSPVRVNYLYAKAFFNGAKLEKSVIGSNELAWRQMQTVLRREPSNEEYLALAAGIGIRVDERIRAYELAEKGLELYPNNARFYQLLGELKHYEGNFPEALKFYQRALQRTRFKGDLYRQLAQLYALQGDSPKAIENWRKVVDWFPWDAKAALELGKLYNQEGQLALAKRYYEIAIKRDSQLADAYYYLAFIHKDLREGIVAIQNFEKYLSLKPDAIEASTVEDEIYFLKNQILEN